LLMSTLVSMSERSSRGVELAPYPSFEIIALWS
jgi:hypothetical protein